MLRSKTRLAVRALLVMALVCLALFLLVAPVLVPDKVWPVVRRGEPGFPQAGESGNPERKPTWQASVTKMIP